MSHRRVTIGRSLDGLIGRGVPFVLVAVVARRVDLQAAEGLVFGLAIVSMVNLATSIGVPTLVMRQIAASGGDIGDSEASLGLFYMAFTAIALPLSAVVLALSDIDPATLSCLLVLQVALSCSVLADYVCLGASTYARYVSGAVLIRGAAGLAAVALAWSGQYREGIVVVAGAGIAPVLAPAAAPVRLLLRKATRSSFGPGRRQIQRGLVISAITALATLISNIDVLARPLISDVELRFELRLALLAVNGVVAVVPIDFINSQRGALGAVPLSPALFGAGVAVLAGLASAGAAFASTADPSFALAFVCACMAFTRLSWRTHVAFLNGASEEGTCMKLVAQTAVLAAVMVLTSVLLFETASPLLAATLVAEFVLVVRLGRFVTTVAGGSDG